MEAERAKTRLERRPVRRREPPALDSLRPFTRTKRERERERERRERERREREKREIDKREREKTGRWCIYGENGSVADGEEWGEWEKNKQQIRR